MNQAAATTKAKTNTPKHASPVFETVLDNGLKVLIQEVHVAPVVSFMVWYKVGSRNERAGITGISHLLEHMMFKGTPTYGKGEIGRLLQRNGASFNAGTSLDYTNYYEVLAADRLELAVRLEADRMVNASIPEDEHRLEMTVVRSELERNEDNPHRALYVETFAHAFHAHPYHWPTIGWRSDVERIRTDEIRDYYKTFYMPNNATVVIVGDVNRDDALELVKRYFGPIPRGAQSPNHQVTAEPPQQGERRFKLRKPGDTRYLMVAYRTPSLTDPDTYALDVLGMILGHGKTSRLHQALVEGKLATEAEASNETARDPFLFIAGATAAPGVSLDSLEAALYKELDRVKSEPVSKAALDRAKKQVEASFIYSMDSIRSLAQRLGYYETVASHTYLDGYIDAVMKVTAEDISRVARKYLVEDSRTVGYYDPIGAGEAVGDTGGAGQSASPEEPATAREGGAPPVVFHYREPDGVSSGAVAAKATTHLARPARVVLPNGLVVLVQENHANPTIAIHGFVKAGGIYDPAGKSGLAAFVASMLDRGASRRTALEHAEAIENVAATLHFDGGAEAVSFTGSMLAEDLGAVLDVLADSLRNPSFPPDQIEKARDELITNVRIADENTALVASRAANELLYPVGHPFHFYPIGSVASLGSITREDLVSFHSAHYGPGSTTLVLVGDVDPAVAVDLVKRAFGDWKSRGKPDPFAVPAVPPPAAPERKTVFLGGRSQVDVVYAVPGIARTSPDYYAAMIMNYILGGGSLSSRLMDNLRDRQGLVYGVYSNLNAGIGAGPLQIRAGTNPANADRTVEGILEQVRRMSAEGPTASELEEAKSYLTGVFPVRLESNAGVAAQILGAEVYGLGLDYIERYPSIIAGVSLEDVRAAAKRYLSPDAYALVIAGTYGAGEPSPQSNR